MKKNTILILALLLIGCVPAEKKELLFNGHDLAGWDTYIKAEADSVSPFGLNNPAQQVFAVVTLDGAPAIRVSGELFGGLSTQQEFENYHLSIQFKWGENKIPSFKDRKRDSGILYHAVGAHGADNGSWMRSQELQVQEGDCGDYWGVAGGVFDITATKNDKDQWIYDPAGTSTTFSATSPAGRRCIKNPDAEKPGEWNTLDLYCLNGTAVHVINDVVVMRLTNSRQEDQGVITPLTKGKIQIQSEGCEVYYRAPSIEKIAEIPARLMQP